MCGWRWQPWAQKVVLPRWPCALLVCCAFPNHKALLGAPLPRLSTICQAISIVIFPGHAVSAVNSRGAVFKNPAFARSHDIWPSRAAVAHFPSSEDGANGPSLDPS